MKYFFTKEDFGALIQEVEGVRDQIKKAAQEVGLSCQQSSETFHDNFGYEQGERDQRMWSSRLRELLLVKNNAEIVFYPAFGGRKVRMGSIVKVRDLETLEDKTFRVGSYMVFNAGEAGAIQSFSYAAPLPQALMGAMEGDYREAFWGDSWHRLVVLKIEQ